VVVGLDAFALANHIGRNQRVRRMLGRIGTLWNELHTSQIARQVRMRNLTYLSTQKMRTLEDALHGVIRDGVEGDFLEFGVALGGSAIVIASQLQNGAAFHGYDVFGMIPPPGPCDDIHSHLRYQEIREGRSHGIGGDTYYGYLGDLYDRVCRSFAEFGMPVDGQRIVLHRGEFGATLGNGEPRPVAFAHIDCDWYDSVKTCLDSIAPRLSPGARVVLDDYNDYGGCRSAVRDFLAAHPECALETTSPSAVLRRKDELDEKPNA
jgi:asparagine synthase (glutamine-hydrolysing)